jgi:hypothetical protein
MVIHDVPPYTGLTVLAAECVPEVPAPEISFGFKLVRSEGRSTEGA